MLSCQGIDQIARAYPFLPSDEIDDTRGEFVLVVDRAEAEQNPLCALTVEQHLAYYMDGGMSKNEAVKAVAHDRNLPKNEIYKLTIK